MASSVVKNVILQGLYGSGTPAGSYLGNELQGLSIDFAQNSALVRGHTTNFVGIPQSLLTVTRASSATYFDASGTLQTASSNILRLDYDPVTHAGLGVREEPQRINQTIQSNAFDNVAWTTSGTTVTANAAVSPDGTSNADRLQIGTNAINGVTQGITATVASQTHTVSCWVKSNTGASQTFRLCATHAGVAAIFSSDMTATTSWQRFTFSQAFGAGGTGINVGVVNDVAGGVAKDLLVYNHQTELNAAFATSCIPTTTVAVTRAKDDLSTAISNFKFDAAVGTVVIEGILDAGQTNGNILASFYVAGNFIEVYYHGAGQIRMFAYNGSVQVDVGSTYVAGTAFKIALGWEVNNFAISVNGAVVATDLVAAVPTGLTALWIGSEAGASTISGTTKKLKHMPVSKANAELVALST